jgi:hypothetical protein
VLQLIPLLIAFPYLFPTSQYQKGHQTDQNTLNVDTNPECGHKTHMVDTNPYGGHKPIWWTQTHMVDIKPIWWTQTHMVDIKPLTILSLASLGFWKTKPSLMIMFLAYLC